jgi:MEMO1 family protein
MNATVREPAVAGQFYPGRRETLRRDIESYTRDHSDLINAIGCIVPHAGYIYSGHVAGAVYGRLQLPRRYVILCPNHTGIGKPLAVVSQGLWRTPLGEVPVDEELAERIKKTCPSLTEDATAHASEHALEVQLPFLQVLCGQIRFVPITVGTSNYDVLSSLGEAIAEATSTSNEPILVVASSDMNHYEDDARTRVKDRKAIDRVLALDPVGLYETVRREQISMCGYGPAVAMLTAVKRLGATSAELIKYATSGDISGDRDAVVGYAGMAVK